MPTPLEYNESRGDMGEHLSILQNRIEAAKEELERAKSKPGDLRAPALENAQKVLEAAEENYRNFKEGNNLGAKSASAGETIH